MKKVDEFGIWLDETRMRSARQELEEIKKLLKIDEESKDRQ